MKIRPRYHNPEAFKVDIGLAAEAQGWVRNRGGIASYVENGSDGDYLLIDNGRRDIGSLGFNIPKAYDGDWIIRHQTGFIVNTPEQFRECWEPA